MTKDRSYAIGLAALQFFALGAVKQVTAWQSKSGTSVPTFFESGGADSDYFFGIACVFKTYVGAIYDKFALAEDADQVQDFDHRLTVFMQDGTSSEWSAIGVRDSEIWALLRRDATRALVQLNELVTSEVASFDIAALIDPSEFRTSAAAKAILREPPHDRS
jgi:hypothetical protein